MYTLVAVLENVNASFGNLNTYLKVLKDTIPALTSGIAIGQTTTRENFEVGPQPNMLQKHFGKMILFISLSLIQAIAVIIMVFQIAGAGGIYPIQTNPQVFGVLYRLWPFTYDINGFIEAIAATR